MVFFKSKPLFPWRWGAASACNKAGRDVPSGIHMPDGKKLACPPPILANPPGKTNRTSTPGMGGVSKGRTHLHIKKERPRPRRFLFYGKDGCTLALSWAKSSSLSTKELPFYGAPHPTPLSPWLEPPPSKNCMPATEPSPKIRPDAHFRAPFPVRHLFLRSAMPSLLGRTCSLKQYSDGCPVLSLHRTATLSAPCRSPAVAKGSRRKWTRNVSSNCPATNGVNRPWPNQ